MATRRPHHRQVHLHFGESGVGNIRSTAALGYCVCLVLLAATDFERFNGHAGCERTPPSVRASTLVGWRRGRADAGSVVVGATMLTSGLHATDIFDLHCCAAVLVGQKNRQKCRQSAGEQRTTSAMSAVAAMITTTLKPIIQHRLLSTFLRQRTGNARNRGRRGVCEHRDAARPAGRRARAGNATGRCPWQLDTC